MIDLDFLERLIKAIDESSIDSVELERGGTRVRLAKSPPVSAVAAPMAPAPVSLPAPSGPAAAPAPVADTGGSGGAAMPPSSRLVDVTSPMVGTFYRAPAPDAPNYVDVGSRVTKGDTVCIIEAMKLMNELECEVSGSIAEICVENAQPVEYGQVLFRVDPS
ncbi:MAG: acetyl-CoA carboxylase biotin carboxyl carrier protein [Gemmatimonadota bacterium]|nr:acetyl-CoA carboxylase biotin carboxyl carrier protein [Gemmatimonadota bacterium]MDH5759385.1 acetyl-CoA carboxylase biotin carboxyl carrier protein [Gemmatimonadota bacterium]